MKRSLIIIFLVMSFMSACTKVKHNEYDSLLQFEESLIIREHTTVKNCRNGWYAPNGLATIDSLVTYEKRKSLCIRPLQNDTTKEYQIYYYLNSEEIEGDSVTFTGKYRYEDAEVPKVTFSIQQYDGDAKVTHQINRSGKSKWINFKVKAAIGEGADAIIFKIYFHKNTQLWLNDCQVEIDGHPLKDFVNVKYKAEEDKEFDKGSNITLEPLSAMMTENLEVLCKVWGFLKYYHPEVTKGKYNWDYELFRILPQVARSKDKSERNKHLNNWINHLGTISDCNGFVVIDSSKYSRFIDLDWIEDRNIFDEKLIAKLKIIKNAKRSHKLNYYFLPYHMGNMHPFTREKTYSQITWKDQGFRVLTLFKLWNAMEYCFPYIGMTDKPWNSLLKEYIPLFAAPANKACYELAITELAACINDTHGNVEIPSSNLGETILARKHYRKQVPVNLIESKEGDIVVNYSQSSELKRGDIIRRIDGETVEKIIKNLTPYIPASNHPALVRQILPFLLRTNNDSLSVTCIRNGKKLSLNLNDFGLNKRTKSEGVKSWQDYNLAAKNIIYIGLGTRNCGSISDIILQKNIKTKGIIIDLRYHKDAFEILNQLLTPNKESFIWFSENEKSSPGNYKLSTISYIGSENLDYYKGKVAILVDEGVQSSVEYRAMAYRKAPNSAIIGSKTAGADGNIGYLSLPGNIKFVYTALGAYYPGWGVCQRKGVNIDIEARATANEIRKGQDVLIEKAIEFIDN